MNYKKIIIKIGYCLLVGIITAILKTPVYLLGLVGFFVAKIVLNKYYQIKQIKLGQENELSEFHIYLKSVILLTYTRPLKIAFTDANKTKNLVLKQKIADFLHDIKYDYTITPYQTLALKINNDTNGINYELNIMFLLYEFEKKGLGTIFINDILGEIDCLMDNVVEQKIENLKEGAYLYTLPPTVLNFCYITIILFQVIDQMIMGVMS